MKNLTVGAIITKNKDKLYNLIDKNDLQGATNLLETYLNAAIDTGKIDATSCMLCLSQLNKVIKKPSAWAGTFFTWQVGGKYKVGRY